MEKGKKRAAGAGRVTTSPGRRNPTAGKIAVAQNGGGSTLGTAMLVGVLVLLVGIGAGAVVVAVSNATRDKEDEKDPVEAKEPAKKPTLADVLEQAQRMPRQEKWKIEPWKPASEDDKLIDRFVRLHNAGDRTAGDRTADDLLAALPKKEPTTDAESERRDAGAFLRRDNVRVLTVWRGEPDANGKPRPSPQRYTLVMKGGGSVPSGYGLRDPVIVVEVKGTIIEPIRTEIYQEP